MMIPCKPLVSHFGCALLLAAGFHLPAPPAASASSFDEGVRLVKEEKYPQAIQAFEREARLNPGSSDVLLNLGWAYWHERQLFEAWRCFDLLVKLDPKNPVYQRLLADIQDERDLLSEALTAAQRAVALAPGDRDAELVLAKVLAHLQRADEAMDLLDKLIKRYPDHPLVQFRTADTLAQLGRLEEAMVYFDKLLHSDPANPAFRRSRAGVLYSLGHTAEAVSEWKVLARQKPVDIKSMVNLGWAAWALKDFDQAEAWGNKLLELEPDNPTYLKFLAEIQLEKEDAVEALELAQRALELRPGDRDIQIDIAKAYFAMQRDEEALSLLNKLDQDFPDDPKIQFQVADFLSQMDREPEALAYFEKLIRAYPSTILYRRRRADLNYHLGRFDRAIDEYKMLASQKPADEASIVALHDDAYNRKAWEEALRWMQTLAGVRALKAEQWQRLATLYLNMGNHQQALAAARKSVELDPLDLAGRYMEAETLEAIADYDAAQRIYEDLLSRNPRSYRTLSSLARVHEMKGEFMRAVKVVRAMQRMSQSKDGWSPYLSIYEARLLAEAGRLETAMKALGPVIGRRQTALPVLLFHGLSAFDRSDDVSQQRFREHMQALRAEGYSPVSVEEVAQFARGGGRMPPKPVLITFDDGRRDSFRYADTVLEETGMKAAMFVHLSGMKRNRFHASPAELKRRRESGRWEMQSHGSLAHDYVPLDAAGHKGHFLANRMWLGTEDRMETVAEYTARLQKDYKDARDQIDAFFPGKRALAFAYPFGDNGQADFTNTPDAGLINERLAQKYFAFSFIQDQYGFNLPKTKATELTRFAVRKDVTPDQLIRHLFINEPWVRGKLLEAALWTRANQPGHALAIYDALRAAGIHDAELQAQDGTAVRQTGNRFGASRLYADARTKRPEEPRYRTLWDQNEAAAGPRLSSEVTASEDNASRRSTVAALRYSRAVKAARVEAWTARGRFSEDQSRSAGGGTLAREGQEAGLNGRWFLGRRFEMASAYSRRRYSGGSRESDSYAGEAKAWVLAPFQVTARAGAGGLDTARSIEAGRRFRSYGGALGWDLRLNYAGLFSYDLTRYSDGNEQRDVQGGLSRRLFNNFFLSYTFRRSTSRFHTSEYYTPGDLKQHLGRFGWSHDLGTPDARTGARRASVKLEYGTGFGSDRGVSRIVQMVRGAAFWRVAGPLALSLDAHYSRSPTYITRTLTGGLNLSF